MRYPALDGLRALAALLVVISHFSNRTGFLGGILGFGGGQLGVMIFFLISGFLMGRLYMEDPFDRAAVRVFAQKRVARVVPLYLVVVVLSAAAAHWLGSASPSYPITRDNLVGHLLFLRGAWALWTIPVEIHFYLLFPAIWWSYSRAGAAGTAAVLLAIAVGLFVPLTTHMPPETLPYHLHYFLIGVVISIVSPYGSPAGSHPTWDGAFVVTLVLTILIVPRVAQTVFGTTVGKLWGSPIALAILTMLLVSCLRSPLAIRILGGTVGRFFGDISYSVYLLHLPVLHTLRLVESLHGNVWVLLVVFLSTVTGVAYLSYRVIEVPSRRFINSRRIGQRKATPVSAA